MWIMFWETRWFFLNLQNDDDCINLVQDFSTFSLEFQGKIYSDSDSDSLHQNLSKMSIRTGSEQ